MDLMKLQNLLNECIMIEQGNYLGGNFSVDLAEVQAELDQAKQLLIPRVVGRNESFVCGHPPKRTYLIDGTWHCEECGGKWESIANK